MGHAFDLLAYYLSSQIYMRARIMTEFKILIDPDIWERLYLSGELLAWLVCVVSMSCKRGRGGMI